MISLFSDIKITLKSGKVIIIPGDDLAFNQELPKFLSMRERYERSIKRMKEKKGVLKIDNGDQVTKVDLTQIESFYQQTA